MALYEFAGCDCDGFERAYPMGEAPDGLDCPHCGARARRRISPPRLSRSGSAAGRLIDRTARTAAEPDVVTSLPSDRRRPGPATTSNPLHRKLPRP